MQDTHTPGRWATPPPYYALVFAHRHRVAEARRAVRDARREERRTARAVARAAEKEKPAPPPAALRRYRVNGSTKLTRRIADFDIEGDVVNGWSDRC